MGYTTEYHGKATIVPPLNPEEIAFINKFGNTRRMDREQGPYYIDGDGFKGQDDDAGVRDHNNPPSGQPGLWCQWEISEDGTSIQWDGGEKFYNGTEWMRYLIDHFLAGTPRAASQVPCLVGNHVVNGTIEAEGEERSDVWTLEIKDNVVTGE